jgi:hypothetical protein
VVAAVEQQATTGPHVAAGACSPAVFTCTSVLIPVQREPAPGGPGPGLRRVRMRFLFQLPLWFYFIHLALDASESWTAVEIAALLERMRGSRSSNRPYREKVRQTPVAWAADAKKAKIALQKSSVSFGQDLTNYTSENREREISTESLAVFDPRKNMEDKIRNIARKKALQRTNLVFGAENTPYQKASTQLDPTGKMGFFRGKLNQKEASLLRKSSIQFGKTATNYESTTVKQNDWDWIEVKKARPPPVISNRHLKPNFTLGDDKVNYTSASKGDFTFRKGYVDHSAKAHAVELKKDLRASHYDLGRFAMDFSTSNNDFGFDIDHAGPLATYEQRLEKKKALVATNICLGNQRTEYESFARSAQFDVEDNYDEGELGY